MKKLKFFLIGFLIGAILGASIMFIRMNEVILRDTAKLKAKVEQLEAERIKIDELIEELEQYRLEVDRVLFDTQGIRVFELGEGN